MKNKLSIQPILFLSAIFFLFLFNCSEKEKFCTIKGTVVNTDTKSILLVKPYEDQRFEEAIEIPVVNGKFEYKIKLDNPEGYTLRLGETRLTGGRYMNVFLENEEMNFTIHSSDEFDKNEILGGKLNAEYNKYKTARINKFGKRLEPLYDSLGRLYENNDYYSEEMTIVYEKINATKSQEERVVLLKKRDELQSSGLDMSNSAKVINDKMKLINQEQANWSKKYINENESIVSYFLFLTELKNDSDDIDLRVAKVQYDKFSTKFKNHPYNNVVFNLINSIEKIKVGEKFIDFSAPDLNGEIVKLSDKINGKIALIDLWATWCGPCISNSRTMVPIYTEFKDKNFTVIGVAGEFKNTDRLTKFLSKEKFPWINLVELDRQNSIWEKYGVSMQGGAIFLVDENGRILAIDPTASEVKNILLDLIG